ncbi:MAG: GIY-YIG nuclease family protein [Verrucomicrobia bacterium]|nr:GIY-YIG nuclease family protein [Verrucomicrobiota bacterium]MDA1005215.1 GIY-YIG nuclease family protein [Verrucomicrobiota bacterium]
MSATPKTIQIFLPGGDPRGIRIAEITTRIVQVIEVPRSLLGDFLQMPECSQVGIYYLIGESENGEPKVYIGQTGELGKRLRQHNSDERRDFWERALVLISRTNSLTQTHALFLEWHSLQMAKAAGRYSDENGNNGSKPHTPAPLEAECLEIFDTGRTLIASLGFPIFNPLVSPTSEPNTDELFYCKGSGANGSGVFTPEGFVVLKGSTGRRENVPSIAGTATERAREKLLGTDVVRIDGDTIIFEKDHLFASPSAAAIALKGRTANGWVEWKNALNKTLDEVKRQQPEEAS